MANRDDQMRFMRHVWLSGDCWRWSGKGRLGNGWYGAFKLDGKNMQAHRAAWILFVGPIPAGMVIDHYLRNEDETRDLCSTLCVNPDHLRCVTSAENQRSSKALARAVRRTGLRNRKHDLPEGVSYQNGHRKSLIAQIWDHGTRRHLGYRSSDTPENRAELAALYKAACLEREGRRWQ